MLRRAASLAAAAARLQRRTLCAGTPSLRGGAAEVEAAEAPAAVARPPPGAGPGLSAFLPPSPAPGPAQWMHAAAVPGWPEPAPPPPPLAPLTFWLETYGCQMNVNDSELVRALLADAGYTRAASLAEASVVALNTCSIREKAEDRVWARLKELRALRRGGGGRAGARRPTVAVLGCMAERLKRRLLDAPGGLCDVVAGPDAYRDLPELLRAVREGPPGTTALNVQLSLDETYADVVPVRRAGATAAFVSIGRGCNNMCAFCVVPFTRGRERSRPAASIVAEVAGLAAAGVREVTLLGQNVNSYCDESESESAGGGGGAAAADDPFAAYAPGFSSVYKPRRPAGAVGFAQLLRRVAAVHPELRVRFTSPHPKDFPDEVLDVVASHPNVCNQLHLPAQSGSDSVLARMGRGYGGAAYRALTSRARSALGPFAGLSTDLIVGFCGETEAEHGATLALVRDVRYSQAFMFAYSERSGTRAARHQPDDVPAAVKARRLAEVVAAFRSSSAGDHAALAGSTHCVLVEGPSRRGGGSGGGGGGGGGGGAAAEAQQQQLMGRTDGGRVAVFEAAPLGPYRPAASSSSASAAAGEEREEGEGAEARAVPAPGEYVAARVVRGTTGTLICAPLGRTTLAAFHAAHGAQSVHAAVAT